MRRRRKQRTGAVVLAALWLLVVPGAAGADDPDAAAEPAAAPEADDLYLDEDDDLYFDEDAEEDGTGDPLETVNRGIFWVNDGLDVYAIEPVSKAWDFVLPDPVQRSLRSVFDNLRFPVLFFNNLFQGKPKQAGSDLARFAINTTVGVGGLMDPASSIGLKKRNEDFGQTLGVWGVPPGPYLMLPFFGPSNLRDGAGLIVDTGFRAFGFFIPFWVSAAMQAVDTLNRRSLIREQIEAERRAALDWYSAVRSAYTQYRENLIKDRREADDKDPGLGYYQGSDGVGDDAKQP
jgi:phospholipid-binding lipoprotein MlaA